MILVAQTKFYLMKIKIIFHNLKFPFLQKNVVMKLMIDDSKLWGHIFWHFNLPWFTPDKNWKKNKKKSKLFWVLLLNNNEAFFSPKTRANNGFLHWFKTLGYVLHNTFFVESCLKCCKIILVGWNHRALYSSKFSE